MIRTIGYSLFSLAGLAALLIWYAARPAVSASSFPEQAIIQFPEAAAVSHSNSDRLKIVTYNIGYASSDKNNQPVALSEAEVIANLNAMVRSLRELDADILCLQEVDFKAERTLDIDQLAYLTRGLGMPYAAFVVVWNKNYLPWPYWPPTAHYGRIVSGQAILSRFPILSHDVHYFKKPTANFFWYNWFYPDKAAQEVTLQVGDKMVRLWNIHLEAFRAEARLEQAKELGRLLDRERSSLDLVAGDFNSVSVSRLEPPEALETLENRGAALKNILETTGLLNAEPPTPIFSIPSWDPIKKIDHILYEPGMILKGAGSLSLTASDHLPIWAEFLLP